MRRAWEIDRRTVLRGAGAALGLPCLEAMIPGVKRARAAGAGSPKRLVFCIFTGGVPDTTIMTGKGAAQNAGRNGSFRPAIAGPDYQLTPILQPLADLKDDVMVISNLHNAIGSLLSTELKYQGGDHMRASQAIMTGVNPEYSDLPSRKVGISVDQVAANTLKQYTPALPSLYLSNPFFSDFNNQLPCFSGPKTMVHPTQQPVAAFKQIFGDPSVDATTVQTRLAQRKSVLHHTRAQGDRLRRNLGKDDQQALDKYLTSVGELETRANAGGLGMCTPPPMPKDSVVKDNSDPNAENQYNQNGFKYQVDVPSHFATMSDLIVHAFQCDRTRVATVLMMTHSMQFSWLGGVHADYARSWHDNVEHAVTAAKTPADAQLALDCYVKGATSEVAVFADLVRKLKNTPEGDGSGTSLLDNTLLVCTSELSYGDGHNMEHLPVIVAGRAGGTKLGRHMVVPEQPIANLWLSMLHAVGIDAPSFGNSTAPLKLT